MFLDIDGVLATQATYKAWRAVGGCMYDRPQHRTEVLFDPECVSLVQELLDQTQAQVVISSTWRNLYPWDFLTGLLADVGITSPIVGRTPHIKPKKMSQYIRRGDEIHAWLMEQPEAISQKDILILEDEEDVRPYRNRQVQTTFYGQHAGFREKHLKRALRLAGLPPRKG